MLLKRKKEKKTQHNNATEIVSRHKESCSVKHKPELLYFELQPVSKSKHKIIIFRFIKQKGVQI